MTEAVPQKPKVIFAEDESVLSQVHHSFTLTGFPPYLLVSSPPYLLASFTSLFPYLLSFVPPNNLTPYQSVAIVLII